MTDITLKQPIRELIAIYEQAKRDIGKAFAIVDLAQDRVAAVFSGPTASPLCIWDGYHQPKWSDPSRFLKQLRVDAWRCIVERLELRRYLSNSAWEKLTKDIEGDTLPDLSVQTVGDLVHSFSSQMGSILADAVKESYDWLRPWRETYKTNSIYEVGKKVIVECAVEKQWNGKWTLRCHQQQRFAALENVFSSLDGAGQTSKGYRSQIYHAVEACEDGVCETKYFKMKLYGNGNIHLQFLRKDLLLEFNRIAGAGKLRGVSAK